MTVPNTSVSVACSVRTCHIAFILWKLIAAVLHLAVMCSSKLNLSSMCVPKYLITLLLCTSMLFTFNCVIKHLAIWWLEPMMINSYVNVDFSSCLFHMFSYLFLINRTIFVRETSFQQVLLSSSGPKENIFISKFIYPSGCIRKYYPNKIIQTKNEKLKNIIYKNILDNIFWYTLKGI